MKYRKILLSVLGIVLLAGFVEAKVIDTVYQVPKTTVAPVIDGRTDPVWKTLDWNFQNSYANGTSLPDSWADLFGASKMMWDDEFVYGLFYAQDDILIDVHANAWERDAVEFYFDADHSRGLSFDAVDDQHINFRHEFQGVEADNIANMGWLTGSVTDGVEFAILDDSTDMLGYWVEWKIPVDAFSLAPIAGTQVGIEWQINDNDGTARDHISKWWLLQGDNSWQQPVLWGTALLDSRVVSTELVILKKPASAAIAIDGALDAIYKAGNPVTQNSHGNGSMVPTDFMDAFIRTHLLYDDEFLYGHYEVYDEMVVDEHANAWERDGVELYTDADNSKGEAFDAVNDQHLTFRHGFIDVEADNVSQLGWLTGTVSDGTEFKVIDTDMGWNVEWKIPLDALGISPVEGTQIGLEIQQNDNDGTQRDHVTKWWLMSGDNSWQQPVLWGTAVLGPEAGAVSVKERPNKAVTKYSLDQNYPNPFNPSTKINFSILEPGMVSLKVYNLLGQEVATLVNEELNAGAFEVNFNAANLSSGTYFYKLQTENTSLTKKMIVLK
jgi:hypothetical protein